MRFRLLAAVAVCIVVGEILLFRAIPQMGIIYLPLGAILVAALTVIPYREYRRVLNTVPISGYNFSPEIVSSKLHNLRPTLRSSALLLLGLASTVDVGLLFLPGSLIGRVLPIGLLLVAIALFVGRFLEERKIATSCAATLGKIVAFEKRGRSRAAVYEYRSPQGSVLIGKGGSAYGFSVGMSMPVLYNNSNPGESLPVTDFLFYRIRVEVP